MMNTSRTSSHSRMLSLFFFLPRLFHLFDLIFRWVKSPGLFIAITSVWRMFSNLTLIPNDVKGGGETPLIVRASNEWNVLEMCVVLIFRYNFQFFAATSRQLRSEESIGEQLLDVCGGRCEWHALPRQICMHSSGNSFHRSNRRDRSAHRTERDVEERIRDFGRILQFET